MAGFTAEEVQEAVDKFVLRQVAIPRLGTGNRDVLAIKDSVYDLIAITLLLRPDVFFYLAWLSKNRLTAYVIQQEAALEAVQAKGPGTTRTAKQVTSTADLTNAQAALLDLGAGASSRTTGFRGGIGPAVDRFKTNIERFIASELTKNVVVTGEVTETADELKASILETWAEAKGRHAELVALAERLLDALGTLSRVSLPTKTLQTLIGRIQAGLGAVKSSMEGSAAVRQSRKAMLELLTMRTLISRASSFRNPERVLMPLQGDGTTLTLLDSDGEEAEIIGSISAPFNYEPGATFTFSVNGGASIPALTLPGDAGSRAELVSRVIDPWVLPPNPSTPSIFVNNSTIVTYGLDTFLTANPGASATDLVNDLNASTLGAEVLFSWDATNKQLKVQSLSSGDNSFLEFRKNSVTQEDFFEWMFLSGGVAFPSSSAGEPVAIEDVVEAIGAASPLATPSAVTTFFASFTGERTATGGEEAWAWNRLDIGTDLVADGTAIVTSPTKSFSALGVIAGMGLVVTAPGGSAGTYAIEEVEGNRLTLASVVAATGAATYYIGPDYSDIPVGARVAATGSDRSNTGLYRLVSGHVARLVVDREFLAEDENLRVTVFTSLLRIAATGTSTSSGISVHTGSSGATAFGFSVSLTDEPASLTKAQLAGSGDFLARSVRAGDTLLLTSPTSLDYTRTVVSVTTNQIVFEPGVPYEAGSWVFEIQSAKAEKFETLQAGLETFLEDSSVVGFDSLDTQVGRLLRGARYSGSIQTDVEAYSSALAALHVALNAYQVPVEKTVDNVVRALQEQGFDRALDLLLDLKLEELFSMDADGVSYKTNVTRKAATAGREVTPVSKYPTREGFLDQQTPVSLSTETYDPLAAAEDS